MRVRKKRFNKKKQMLTMGLLGVMILSFGGSAVATNYNNEHKVPVSNYREDNLDINPVQSLLVPRQYSNLESAYNSEDYGYITSVKSQNPYGTCWSFATMAASEASMIKEGLGEKDSLDLSEWQLAYFTAHSVTDPLGGTAGDCFALKDTDYLNSGGNQQIATYRIANWYGVADETTAPYSTISQYTDAQIAQALAHTLPDSAAYSQDIAHLENAYWISMSDSAIVKQMIKQYGACGASYYSADEYYNTGSADAWYAEEEVAVYCPTAAAEGYANTNHAITIVGWDDNYSKSNFKSGAQPENDGAWYCKNSWGPDWSKDGYFWISYEDARLKEETAFFFDYGAADNYDNNYQYDGGAWGFYIEGYNAIANIYTAKQAEYVKAVGFYTDNSNYNCKVYIYKNVDSADPYSGSLVLEQTANQLYAGFHTVELSKPIEVKEGESYSVVVYQTAADGGETKITLDSDTNSGWFTNTVTTEAGQSFIGTYGGYMWDAGVEYSANCRIKAYTDNKVLVNSLELGDSEVSLYTGDTTTLSVTVAPENADDKTVAWSSSDESVATVDEDGVVTAVKAGTATITCEAQDGSGVKTTCDVSVKQWVTSVTLDCDKAELLANETLQLNAKVLPTDATNKTLSWTSTDESVAMVSDEGVVTGKAYGETTIICTAADRSHYYTMCTIQVYEPVESIVLNETSAIIDMEETLQLSATVTPTINKTRGVAWSSSDDAVATVDENGRVTPVSSGNVEIHCTAMDGTGVEATCNVTVKKRVTSVELDYEIIELLEGGTLQLTETVLPVDATDKSVNWKSFDEGVATVSEDGVVTAKEYGETMVMCTSVDNENLYVMCEVVVRKPVANIELSESSITVHMGETLQLSATVTPDVGKTQGVSWIVTDDTVVEVDATGLVTPISIGETTIRCVAKDGTEIQDSCRVVVEQWATGIRLDDSEIELIENNTFQLSATVLPDTTTNQSVEWSSLDESVATVDENGKITAIGYGETAITCTAADRNQYSATCKVRVLQPISSLILDASDIKMEIGDIVQLSAVVTPDISKTKGVAWDSSDDSVVKVSEDGNLTAVAGGTATITCEAQDGSGVKATCEVTVNQWVASVELNCEEKEMKKGDSMQLVATVSPSTASNQEVAWVSSDDSVVVVSDDGAVTAMGYGEATITCTATDRNQHFATCEITVYEPVTTIALNHNSATVDVGDTLQLDATVTPDVYKTKGVYWTSSDKSIATVDDQGLVTAISVGTTTIQCIAKDGSGVKASCLVSTKEKVEILAKGAVILDASGKVKYKVTKNGNIGATVQLIDGKTCTGTYVVPATITEKGVTYKVTSIGASAFANNKAVKKVKLGNNITSIGKNAFSGCSKLNSVTIGSKVTTIGDKAFYRCSGLVKIVIPAKVNKIGKQAFYKCGKLKTITIKTTKLTKKKVGSKAFSGIHAKATIKVPKKKLSAYKSILKARGIGKKVKVKKY